MLNVPTEKKDLASCIHGFQGATDPLLALQLNILEAGRPVLMCLPAVIIVSSYHCERNDGPDEALESLKFVTAFDSGALWPSKD